MFEAVHSARVSAAAADVWGLWADPQRWADWNEQIERVELDGQLEVGAEVRVKLRRGGTVRFSVLELEPERSFIDEARFPGARMGHEHRLDPGDASVQITHRLYVSGPLSGFWALMLGRKQMRESVERFVQRERELTEPQAPAQGKRRQR